MRSGQLVPPITWRGGWVVRVTGHLLREAGADKIRSVLPNGYALAYCEDGCDVGVWMPALIAQCVGFWHGHRWDVHVLLMRLGLLDQPGVSAPYYRDLRWRWDFWNGTRSWLAFRYAQRHGYDAYKARFL